MLVYNGSIVEGELLNIIDKPKGKVLIYRTKKGYIITTMEYIKPAQNNIIKTNLSDTVEYQREYYKNNRQSILERVKARYHDKKTIKSS